MLDLYRNGSQNCSFSTDLYKGAQQETSKFISVIFEGRKDRLRPLNSTFLGSSGP